MPKWIKSRRGDCIVYTDDDLKRAEQYFIEADRLWKKHYKDDGSVVIGAGIAVLYLPPRCLNPKEKIVISSPGQGDGSDSVNIPLNLLALYGIGAWFEPGRMD